MCRFSVFFYFYIVCYYFLFRSSPVSSCLNGWEFYIRQNVLKLFPFLFAFLFGTQTIVIREKYLRFWIISFLRCLVFIFTFCSFPFCFGHSCIFIRSFSLFHFFYSFLNRLFFLLHDFFFEKFYFIKTIKNKRKIICPISLRLLFFPSVQFFSSSSCAQNFSW